MIRDMGVKKKTDVDGGLESQPQDAPIFSKFILTDRTFDAIAPLYLSTMRNIGDESRGKRSKDRVQNAFQSRKATTFQCTWA